MKKNFERVKICPLTRKLILTMRLLIFVFFAGVFTVSANSTYSQNTSFNLELGNITLEEVFQEIESTSEFIFFYFDDAVDIKRKVDLNIKNRSIYEVLDELFQNTNNSYKVFDRQIIIFKNESLRPIIPRLNTSIGEEIANQQIIVKGIVTDTEGNPLPGVNIVEKGTTKGTVTNVDGEYTISVASFDAILMFSFVGFLSEEVQVNEQTTLDVMLVEDIMSLDEVVVVGYGTMKRSDLTGAVSSIDDKALDRQVATNVTELLKSALPGLNITTSTSAKGSSGLEVRGPNSLRENNSPLLVVDDVIYQGDISDINPIDIEKIDVLKDASSAAIYGAKAASGVVIITTRKGKSSKPTINFRSSFGAAQVNKMEDVYSPEEYLEYRRDVLDRFDINSPAGYYSNPANLPSGVTLQQWLEYDNLGGTETPPEDIWLGRLQLQQIEVDNYKAGKTLDWGDILFQTGLRKDNNLSLSGKADNISYYTSLGYVDNEGIQIYQKYENFRARINLDAEVNKFLSVGMNVQANESKEPKGIPDARSLYDKNSPFGSLYYEDGTYKHEPHDDNLGGNPYIYEYRDNRFREREVFANLYGLITLPFGFSYKLNWINRYSMEQDYRFTPSKASLGEGGASGSRYERTHYGWMIDNILKWNKTIMDIHDFDVTLLYNAEEDQLWSSSQSNSEFDPNESLTYHNLAIGLNPTISNEDYRSTGDALMARLNYDLLDKYLLTLSVRRDGYSAFGQKNPRATFPSVAVGWRISEENFLNVAWLSNLKLRLSWGENGNREIGRYAALSQMNTTKYIYDHSSVTGIYSINLANEELKWERTTAYNVGLDFAVFGGRISGAIDAYHMSTTDLLLERTLPDITGYSSVYANLGEVQNQGMELALNTVNIEKSNFSWRSTFSFWFNRNEIKHLYGDMVDVFDGQGNVTGQREEDDIQNGWYIGHAIDEIFDYKIAGVWQLGEEDEAAIYGRSPGDAKLVDVNEDGIIDFDDKVFQGYTKPRYRVSLRNDFAYKNFDMSFLLNSFLDYYGANNEHFNYRVAQERLNKIKTPYWTPENPTNEWTRLYSNNFSPATNWWESKSFVRLQNLTVGYTLPKNILQKIRIERFRIYGNIQNFQAISGWQYNWDVETSSPTPMIYTFGVDLSL